MNKIYHWSVFCSLGIIFFKISIFSLFGFGISWKYTMGTVCSFFGNAFAGLVIGCLLFSKSLSIRIFGFVFAMGIFLLYLVSFHYELTFRSLPDLSSIYYLSEFRHLMPSIKSNLPFGIIMAEIMSVFLFIILLKLSIDRYLKKRSCSKKLTVFYCLFFIASFAVPFSLHFFSLFKSDSDLFWSTRNPVFWFVHSSFSLGGSNTKAAFAPKEIWNFQREIGHYSPFGGISEKYPLWSNLRKVNKKTADKKSVIILILESVGTQEMFSKVNGEFLMPNLLKISQENLFFKNTCAGGTKSNQVLPAIFSGVPPQTFQNILWRKPLPNLDGLPGQFAKNGYKTAYFHGSDLSFEQQRAFLKMAGFEYIFDYDPALEKTVSGWGYDDRTMFSFFRDWIEKQNVPYFAALFTLSTHDPFILPQDWKPKFASDTFDTSRDGTWFKFITIERRYEFYRDSLFFLDTELGKFYEWYKKEEMPKGTLLVILSDHVTYLHNEALSTEKEHMRFLTPLIFAGISGDLLRKYEKYTNRRAAHFDLPATLTDYIGIDPLPSDQGLNLFMQDTVWPEDRLIYSVGGEHLEKIYVWSSQLQALIDRSADKFEVINFEVPQNFVPAESAALKQIISDRIVPFFNVLLPLNQYLLEKNAYAPSEKFALHDIKPLPKVTKPIIASHRGNVSGMREKEKENKEAAIEEAVRAGFEWIEIDVLGTKDGIPVLLHDNEIADGSGKTINIENITFEELKMIPAYADIMTLESAVNQYIERTGFLIEIKPMGNIDSILVLNRKISDFIYRHPLRHKMIIDSFSELSAGFVKNRCDCNVGIDAPYKEKLSKDFLQFVKFSGFDWIYVHHEAVNSELIGQAHEIGLKIMVYTVNDLSVMSVWEKNWPDGIITDYRHVKDEIMSQITE